jgi:hypothetical protein
MEYRTRGLMLARLVDAQWWWLRRMLTFVELRTKAQGGTCRNETDEVGAARAGPAGHQNPPVRKGQRR